MPFDGEHHGISDIYPMSYHSNSHATPKCLQQALSNSYCVSRTEGRFIGYQTYKRHFSDFTQYLADATETRTTSFVDVAAFRKQIPTHATDIVVDFWFRAFSSGGGGEARMKILVETGSPLAEDASVNNISIPVNSAPIPAHGHSIIPQEIYNLHGSVPISAASGAASVITVSGYVVSNASVGMYMLPVSVAAWWVTKG